jgi:hypothetical protein
VSRPRRPDEQHTALMIDENRQSWFELLTFFWASRLIVVEDWREYMTKLVEYREGRLDYQQFMSTLFLSIFVSQS